MKRCAGFEVTLKLGEQVRAAVDLSDGVEYMFRKPWGWKDMFRKPWEEVVCPSSPYFGDGDGALMVRLPMTPVMKEEGDDGDGANDEGDH